MVDQFNRKLKYLCHIYVYLFYREFHGAVMPSEASCIIAHTQTNGDGLG